MFFFMNIKGHVSFKYSDCRNNKLLDNNVYFLMNLLVVFLIERQLNNKDKVSMLYLITGNQFNPNDKNNILVP